MPAKSKGNLNPTLAVVYQSEPQAGGASTYEKNLSLMIRDLASKNGFSILEFFPSSKKVKHHLQNKSSEGDEPRLYYQNGFLELSLMWILRSFPGRKLLGAFGIRRTKFENHLIKKGVNCVYFASPNPLALGISQIPMVTTVWDLGHRDLPEYPEFSAWGRWQSRELYYSETVPRSLSIVTDSKFTSEGIQRYYGADPNRVVILGLLPRKTQPSENHHLVPSKPYVIYPAQKWPHKNHKVLLQAMKILKDQGRGLKLVLTGSDKGFGVQISKWVKELGLESDVIDLGFVAERDLALLISKSKALAMPSRLGPTNLPPLEAILLGVPAVVSDAHKFDAYPVEMITFCDPDSPDQWAEAIHASTLRNQGFNHGLETFSERAAIESLVSHVKKAFVEVGGTYE
jgi:glycosyltransferase involved in cell wall biosynthesis